MAHYGKVRRVVTGINEDGYSVIKSDSTIEPKRQPNGAYRHDIWATTESPCDVLDPKDGGDIKLDTIPSPGGTRVVIQDVTDYESAMHITRSIDYGILIEGEMELILDDGSVTLLSTPGI
jgi:hypothetical protein